jgi:DNA-binding transcriptional LysR family regulator
MDLIGDLILMQELAEHGSFSKVGRLRGQAPSSIARRLDRLENHLNDRLFNRAPTGLFLTASGTRKLFEGRALTDAAASFVNKDGENGNLSGHLVISAPSRLGETLIAQAVAQFLTTHPNVSIDLHFTDLVQNLERDKIDLSVRVGTQSPDHHFIRRIVENRRILVAAPAYLARFDQVKSVTDLDAHSGLFLGRTLSWRLMKSDMATHVARPKARLRAVAGDVLLTMCKAGLGIALKSSWDVRRDLAEGEIVQVLPEWQQADPSDIMIVTPSRRLVSPTIKAFSKMLGDYLKRTLAASE